MEDDNMPSRVEEMASKAMGAMKAVKATVEGLSGVFKQLTKEHGEVSALLMRVKLSSDLQVRRDLFPTIRRELLAHEMGEMREVYPTFDVHPELKAMVTEHDREAREIEQILSELYATAYDAEGWAPRFGQLVEAVKHHTSQEEKEYFPKANRILGKEQVERMQARYEACKAGVLKEMST
jgi:hypothetical protein